MGSDVSKKHGIDGSWAVTPYEHDRLSDYIEENEFRALVRYKHKRWGAGYGVYTFTDDPANDDPIIWFELLDDAQVALDDENCYNAMMGKHEAYQADNEDHPLWGMM